MYMVFFYFLTTARKFSAAHLSTVENDRPSNRVGTSAKTTGSKVHFDLFMAADADAAVDADAWNCFDVFRLAGGTRSCRY